MKHLSRRRFLVAGAAGSAALFAALVPMARVDDPVHVVGGGIAGASAALTIRAARPGARVILIERDPTRLAGRPGGTAEFLPPVPPVDHARLAAAGVGIAIDEVAGVDWDNRRLDLFSGRQSAFGMLVLAPGVAPRDEGIAGFDPVAQHMWPAAWGSAREARRLAGQLAALPANGHVVMRLPEDAGGLPAVAAHRALRIAMLLRRTRPAARLTVLDAATDSQAARIFAQLQTDGRAPAFPVMWLDARNGGQVLAVDAPHGILETTAGRLRADVVNFIPRQGAAEVARTAGLVDDSGWCPCDGQARSLLQPAALVIGDARKGAERNVPAALRQGRQVAALPV